jgi:predicted Zn-dependent protease
MRTPAIFLLLAALLLTPCAADAARDMRLIRDQEIESDMRAMSSPVFEQAGLSPQTVKFILVEDSNLNAFVAGGQNIFVHTGLILETENPEELVGVIAHETGHIAGGHLFRTQEAYEELSFQAMLAQVLGLAVAAGARSGEAAVVMSSAGQSILWRTMLRHSRVQESAADQSGVRYLKDAGIPVTGFLSFMQKLASQELLPDSQQAEYVRTHPLSRDRVDFLEHTAATIKGQGAVPSEWVEMHKRMKAKLLGYLYPDRALADKTDMSFSGRYGRAIATYRKGKPTAAVALVDPLIAEEPQNPYLHELKAQILFENGQISESLPSYAKATSLAAFSGLIRAAYGHALMEAGRTEDAIRELNKSLVSEPRNARTWRLLATGYGKQGHEGPMRLSLAEEALLKGNLDAAGREAAIAQKVFKKNSASWVRANDIMDTVKKLKERQKKRKR